MPEAILCKICGKRRARRACPAVGGDICTLCCGTEREVTLTCPLECEYLREAHRREKPSFLPDGKLANADISVSEEFLRAHEELLVLCAYSLVQASLRVEGALDSDVMDALEALIQTHRTLESGLFYETRSENAVAAAIQRSFSALLAEYQKARSEREHVSASRNTEVLAVLVFLQRLGQRNQNGRPRGRMYLDLLSQMAPAQALERRASSLIL